MKVITLLPIKNEAWILESALENFSKFSDHIIVADQSSTDGSREICARFPKVTLINNSQEYHSNEVRRLLLAEARKITGNNFIMCLDVDEIIPVAFFEKTSDHIAQIKPGMWMEFKWVQAWKSLDFYRSDGPWKDSWKAVAFLDDRKLTYPPETVINDHTQRVPGAPNTPSYRVKEYPLLHLQFVAWERNEEKQAWYRCNELIQGKKPRPINHKYSVTSESSSVVLTPLPAEWLHEIKLPENLKDRRSPWYLEEIKRWFDRYGIIYFEPLEIWHIPELHKMFVDRYHREPITKRYSPVVIWANSIKNRLIR